MVIEIIEAQYFGDYKIKIHFSDNICKIVDFEHFLNNSRNPMTKKYLDKDLFKSFHLLHGDLIWNDYEMCFPIWSLYQGKL